MARVCAGQARPSLGWPWSDQQQEVDKWPAEQDEVHPSPSGILLATQPCSRVGSGQPQ